MTCTEPFVLWHDEETGIKAGQLSRQLYNVGRYASNNVLRYDVVRGKWAAIERASKNAKDARRRGIKAHADICK